MVFGAYIGICLDVIYLNGTIQKINVTKNWKKGCLRILIVLVLSLILMVPRYFDTYMNRFDYPLEHTLINFLAFFTLSLLFFSFLKKVFQWLKLVKEVSKNRFLV